MTDSNDQNPVQPLVPDPPALEVIEMDALEAPTPVLPPPSQMVVAGEVTKKTVEDWSTAKSTHPWDFAAAKGNEGWGQGRLLSEVEYDAAVKKACSTVIGPA